MVLQSLPRKPVGCTAGRILIFGRSTGSPRSRSRSELRVLRQGRWQFSVEVAFNLGLILCLQGETVPALRTKPLPRSLDTPETLGGWHTVKNNEYVFHYMERFAGEELTSFAFLFICSAELIV